MRLRFIFQFILRELLYKKDYPLQIILSIAVGVGAVVGINSYKENLYNKIEKESRNIMGGDLVIESNSHINEETYTYIRDSLPQGSIYSKIIKFSSMIYGTDSKENSLATIKAVESNFPFFGEVITSPKDAYHNLQADEILLEESLVQNLNVQIGDKIGIGKTDFIFKGTIIKEPITSGSYYAMAPTCIISIKDVVKTELESRGSRIRYSLIVKLPEQVDSLKLKESIFKKFIQKDLMVYHHREAGSRTQKLITNTLDYMSFLGLNAMFIGAVTIVLSCRKKVKEKVGEIAILKCLGAKNWFYITLFLIELLLLSFFGTFIGIGLGYVLQYFLPNIQGLEFMLDIEPGIGLKPLLSGIGIGMLLPVFITIESIYKIGKTSPLLAIRSDFEVNINPKIKPQIQSIIEVIFVLFLFTTLSFLEIQDITKSLLLCLVLLSIPILLYILYFLFRLLTNFFLLFTKFPKHFRLILKKIEQTGNGLSIIVPGVGTSLVILFIALVMEDSILNTGGGIEQIEKRPNMFAMDIRKEQLEEFMTILGEYPVKQKLFAPVINARLSKINGKPIQKEDTEIDALKRDWKSTAKTREYFLSYREDLYETEKVLSGKFWEKSELPQISIETEFSKALGVGIGDRLEFNVQGIHVEGLITNIRMVQWIDMKPNFVVIFSPGTLEKAPATYISSFRIDSFPQRYKLQKETIAKYPNITTIDMEKAIDRFTGILKKITNIVKMMTLFILISSILLLITTLNSSKKEKIEEATLLKILGGTSIILRKIYSIEAILVASYTFLCAFVLTVIASHILLNYFLNLYVIFPWLKILIIFGFVIILMVSIYMIHIHKTLKQAPGINSSV
ncbi:MAG: FtsX-like permease family protein [Leptospiraceae bacterium]|nr:FtsX-like permease family protein [Leptospiraceae bacterium]